MIDPKELPYMQELMATAIVGTGRHTFPAIQPDTPLGAALARLDAVNDPADRLLKALAVLAYYEMMGQVAVIPDAKAILSSAPVSAPYRTMPAELVQLLEECPLTAQKIFFDLWLTTTQAEGLSVPPEMTLTLLGFAQHIPRIQPQVLALLGPRATWMALFFLTIKQRLDYVWVLPNDRELFLSVWDNPRASDFYLLVNTFRDAYIEDPSQLYDIMVKEIEREEVNIYLLSQCFEALPIPSGTQALKQVNFLVWVMLMFYEFDLHRTVSLHPLRQVYADYLMQQPTYQYTLLGRALDICVDLLKSDSGIHDRWLYDKDMFIERLQRYIEEVSDMVWVDGFSDPQDPFEPCPELHCSLFHFFYYAPKAVLAKALGMSFIDFVKAIAALDVHYMTEALVYYWGEVEESEAIAAYTHLFNLGDKVAPPARIYLSEKMGEPLIIRLLSIHNSRGQFSRCVLALHQDTTMMPEVAKVFFRLGKRRMVLHWAYDDVLTPWLQEAAVRAVAHLPTDALDLVPPFIQFHSDYETVLSPVVYDLRKIYKLRQTLNAGLT